METLQTTRLMRDVKRINLPRRLPIRTREDVDRIVEEPLRPIVWDLHRKGIHATETSANLDQTINGKLLQEHSAWLYLDAVGLSDENNRVLEEIQERYNEEWLNGERDAQDAEPQTEVDLFELPPEGYFHWSIRTDIHADEPIEAVTDRISHVTDQLLPQEKQV